MLAVMGHAAAGLTEAETAAALGVSKWTVKSVRGATVERMGVRNAMEAVAELARRGDV